jgi:hypothetical protein
LLLLSAIAAKQLWEDIAKLAVPTDALLEGLTALSLDNPLVLLVGIAAGGIGALQSLFGAIQGQRGQRLLAFVVFTLIQVWGWFYWTLLEQHQSPVGAYVFVGTIWGLWTFIIGPFALILAVLPAEVQTGPELTKPVPAVKPRKTHYRKPYRLPGTGIDPTI